MGVGMAYIMSSQDNIPTKEMLIRHRLLQEKFKNKPEYQTYEFYCATFPYDSETLKVCEKNKSEYIMIMGKKHIFKTSNNKLFSYLAEDSYYRLIFNGKEIMSDYK